MKNYEITFFTYDEYYKSQGIARNSLSEKKEEITLEELEEVKKIRICDNKGKWISKYIIDYNPYLKIKKQKIEINKLKEENKYLNDQLNYYKSINDL